MLNVLKEKVKRLRQYCAKLSAFFSGLERFAAISWLVEYRDRIASYLYIFCLAGFAYWIYRFIIIDAKPQVDRLIFVNDSRDALTFLFFGVFGLIYVIFFASFIIKFVYNMIRGGIDSLVPEQWYSLIKSVFLLICLKFAFLYIENIKTAGLTAYMQCVEVVQTSRQYTPVVKKNVDVLRLLEALGKDQQD